MTGNTSLVDLVADVATTVVSHASARKRADLVLDRLCETLPIDAALLTSYDPVHARHSTLTSTGYTSDVVEYLANGFPVRDPAFTTMRFGNPTPLRWCDIPTYRSMFSAHDVLIPNGFSEGSTCCLFTKDGRYVGALHVNSQSPMPLSDAQVNTLRSMQPVIAALVDARLHDPSIDRTGAVLIGHCGKVEEIAPAEHPCSPWLVDDSPLIQRLLARGPAERRFVWVAPDLTTHVVHVWPVPSGICATARACEVPMGLSPREVQVLELVADGLTNQEIGTVLAISRRTVATHLEHIFAKLGCDSRLAAVSHSVGAGIIDIGASPVRGGRDAQHHCPTPATS